ncbi:MAG TPA: O-antigen ligase family protein [bacterium]
MKSLLATSLSSGFLWVFACALTGIYLLFHPPLFFSQSYAVALGGGLILFFFKSVSSESFFRMGKAWWFFLLWLLLTSFWSLSPGLTLQSAGFVFLGTLLYLMSSSNDPAASSRLEVAGLLAAGAAAIVALDQQVSGFRNLGVALSGFSGEEFDIVAAAVHNKRSFGPLVTPGALAALMILFIPLAFTLAKIQRGGKRFFYALWTVLLVAGLFASQSIGALACLVAAVLVVLWNRQSKGWVAGALAFGMAGAGWLLWQRGLQSWLLAAFSMRLKLWGAALTLFGQHPFFGTGLGTFGEAYQLTGLDLGTGARFAHNLFFQLLVETGLVGTAIFLIALVSLGRRFQKSFRWEGWGVMTGVLAFGLFSLFDLPFQMPELVWLFSVVAGRLTFKAEKEIKFPELSGRLIQWFVLAVLLVSGFWPPFRPWNFALLAVILWTVTAYYGAKWEKIPLWIFAGSAFLILRAFYSPSALGCVWFLEITGVLLAFSLILSRFEKPKRFLTFFFILGLAWALKVWWESFHYAAPGLNNWLHFQYSDVKDWTIFPNPKQVGIFLVPLIFLFWKKPIKLSSVFIVLVSLLTLVRLRAFAAFLGFGIGWIVGMKRKNRWMAVCAVIGLVAALLIFRSFDSSSTKWERLGIWKSAGRVWLMSPWVGVGPGAFAGYFDQVKKPRVEGVSRYLMDAQYAHNEILDFLAAFGLVGFLFAACFFWQRWKALKDPEAKAGLTGLGAASLVDFCLHTSLIALQGAGLLVGEEKKKREVSYAGGFLALGVALGLFGSAAFAGILKSQSDELISQKRFPEALRCLETAEQLNPWDSRVVASKAGFLEQLYLATGDTTWERKSDVTFENVLDLEKADGQRAFEKAERLTFRLGMDKGPAALEKTRGAWDETKNRLPFNGLVREEEGVFFLKEGEKDKALQDFQKAGELEPNYALAWVNAGNLLKEKGDNVEARQFFVKALEVYNQWKDAERIDLLEKQMVYLSPEVLVFLKKETSK